MYTYIHTDIDIDINIYIYIYTYMYKKVGRGERLGVLLGRDKLVGRNLRLGLRVRNEHGHDLGCPRNVPRVRPFFCSLPPRTSQRQVVHRVSSSLLVPANPSFRALSGRLKFTVRRHTFNKNSLAEARAKE